MEGGRKEQGLSRTACLRTTVLFDGGVLAPPSSLGRGRKKVDFICLLLFGLLLSTPNHFPTGRQKEGATLERGLQCVDWDGRGYLEGVNPQFYLRLNAFELIRKQILRLNIFSIYIFQLASLWLSW